MEDATTESAREAALAEIRHQLEVWLDFFSGPESLRANAARELARAQRSGRIDESLAVFGSRLEENEFAWTKSWTLDQRRVELRRSEGVHVAWINVDGSIDIPEARGLKPTLADGDFLKPEAIAETYWHIAHRDPSAWTMELEVRPFKENF